MRICVCGWYYEFEFYEMLQYLPYESFVVAHRMDNLLSECNLSWELIENIGLEWGAYSHYLNKHWNGGDILFMHDDVIIENPVVFLEIARLQDDQAYIFRDVAEELANGRKHGRAIFCSHKFLEFAKTHICDCTDKHAGFWFDKDAVNIGIGRDGQRRDHNLGIFHFAAKTLAATRRVGLNVAAKRYFPAMKQGRRGKWGHEEREKKRYAPQM